MDPTTPPDRATLHHRALANPVRVRILGLLGAREEPQDIETLADDLELHPNTIRAHLAILAEAALVTCEPDRRRRPGRPRLVYRLGEAGTPTAGEDGYRLLAEILAGCLTRTADAPSTAAEDAGIAWGRSVVEGRPATDEHQSGQDAVTSLVRLHAELGFDPALEGDVVAPRILLHRCPFAEVAREHQDIVCSIHLGLMRGALDALGVAVVVEALHPLVEPSLCVTDLRRPV